MIDIPEGVTLKCVKSKSSNQCSECYFRLNGKVCGEMPCSPTMRKDMQAMIFVEVKDD